MRAPLWDIEQALFGSEADAAGGGVDALVWLGGWPVVGSRCGAGGHGAGADPRAGSRRSAAGVALDLDLPTLAAVGDRLAALAYGEVASRSLRTIRPPSTGDLGRMSPLCLEGAGKRRPLRLQVS